MSNDNVVINGAVTTALEALPPVATALARVAGEVGAVGKNDRNLQQGYNFRGVDAVVNAAGPVLHRHGIIVVPEVQNVTLEAVEVGQKRTPMRSAVLTIRFRFVGPAGDHIDATTVGEAMDSGDKAVSKAQSVALRVALLQVLTLPTHEPDPDESTYERSVPRRARSGEATTTAVPPAMMKRLQTEFSNRGVTDRAERLSTVAQIIGRDVASANDLTKAEAQKVIDHLAAQAPAGKGTQADPAAPTEREVAP